MKSLIIILCLAMVSSECLARMYVKAGTAYNFDAWGDYPADTVIVTLGYRHRITDHFKIEVSGRHESDPKNSGVFDKVSNNKAQFEIEYEF